MARSVKVEKFSVFPVRRHSLKIECFLDVGMLEKTGVDFHENFVIRNKKEKSKRVIIIKLTSLKLLCDSTKKAFE